MDGEVPSDITIDEADPLIGDLRTWPQIRRTTLDKPDAILNITNLKTGINKLIKEKTSTITKGVFGALLKAARDTGTDFSIQAHSQSPYTCRRDSYEVAWGTHVYRCKRKHNTGPMLCKKCNQPLTNTHLLGGCKYNAKFRTSRHTKKFKLLHDLLQTHNCGRWPILNMDLGNKSMKEFKAQTHIERTTIQEDHTLQFIEATKKDSKTINQT